METNEIAPSSLVVYKGLPARVNAVADKIEIETVQGDRVKVRPKDIVLLHPGPVATIGNMATLEGDVETAWSIAQGSTLQLKDLAELLFDRFDPATAWSTWATVAAGTHFEGSPDCIVPLSAEEVERRRSASRRKEESRQERLAFLERAKANSPQETDRPFLVEVEQLALGQRAKSPLLRELGIEESPRQAHSALLRWGTWSHMINPHPTRIGLRRESALVTQSCVVPPETRLDLTHLTSYAIDDAGTDTPDDAIAIDGRTIWVHIADVASLVTIDSPLAAEAMSRGSTAHLPEGHIPMLPRPVVDATGVGLTSESPVLSIGFALDDDLCPTEITIQPATIRAQRLTYEEAEAKLHLEPLRALHEAAKAYRERRSLRGAVQLEFPECRVDLAGDRVELRRLERLASRVIVQETMIMAGQAAALYASSRGIPVPYTLQDAPEATDITPISLAEMYAFRRKMRRRHYSSQPGQHAGLGLDAYVQITSPLRRYLDLVVHQQLRAHLTGASTIPAQDLLVQVGAGEAAATAVREAEDLSVKHWTLVYLLQQPDWTGKAVVVDRRGSNGTLLIPDLALETQVPVSATTMVDSVVQVRLREVDLPSLRAVFTIL